MVMTLAAASQSFFVFFLSICACNCKKRAILMSPIPHWPFLVDISHKSDRESETK